MKFTLLLSFVETEKLYDAIDQISKTLNMDPNYIFVFKSDHLDGYILTFNLNPNKSNIQYSAIWPNTISIHRKKQTNTLYSLNAMNQMIKNENNGVFKSGYKLNWETLNNSLLIVKNNRLEIFRLDKIKINR